MLLAATHFLVGFPSSSPCLLSSILEEVLHSLFQIPEHVLGEKEGRYGPDETFAEIEDTTPGMMMILAAKT